MKNYLKILLVSVFVLGGWLSCSPFTNAYSQTSANGYLHFEQSGSYRLLWNDNSSDTIISNSSANNGVGFVATSTLGTFGTITDVSASFKNQGSATSTVYAVVSCVDGTGTHTITTSNQDLAGSATTFQNLTYSFSLTCDSSTMTQVQINFFSTGWQSNDLQIQADNTALSAGKGITYYQPSPGNDAFNQSYILRIAINNGGFTTFAITSPAEFSTLRQNSDRTLSGTCLTDGHTITIREQTHIYTQSGICSGNAFSISVPIGSAEQYCFRALDIEADTETGSVCYFANVVGESTDSSITWAQPPFIVASTSPLSFSFLGTDFSVWQLALTLQPRSTITGYYYKVLIGTSTMDTEDSLKTQVGVIPLSQEEFNNGFVYYSVPLNKNTVSAPGNYIAKAFLFDENDATISSSSLLSLTIVAGATTTYPSNFIKGKEQECPATDFALHLYAPPIDIDFGRGFCKAYNFLFVPKEEDFTQFSLLWESIKTKPPFGYFTMQATELSELSTTTPATVLLDLSAFGSFKTAFDGAIALIIVTSFGLFLWRRFRTFDFHH